jgi:quercetin dioxygenase-like cupin family protein
MSSSAHPVRRPADAHHQDFPWGSVSFLASRRLGNSTTMTFGRATMQPGHRPTRHRHPNCDEILHVLSGRVRHSLGEEFFELSAGDTISIPMGVWHGAEALGDETAEMTICFSSADRETDFEV